MNVLIGVGTSQAPLVRSGDIIEWERVVPAKGDLAICLKQGRMICHRVLDIERVDQTWYFLVKGDRVVFPDGWFVSQDVLGRVSAVNHLSTRSVRFRFRSSVSQLRSRWVGGLHWIFFRSPLGSLLGWARRRLYSQPFAEGWFIRFFQQSSP